MSLSFNVASSWVFGQSTGSQLSKRPTKSPRANQCARSTSRRTGWFAGRNPPNRHAVRGNVIAFNASRSRHQ